MKKLLIFFLLFICNSIFAEIVPYNMIDSILKKTWDQTYPVTYTKIVKKDISNKGIMVIRNTKGQLEYLYSFIIFLPRYKYENDQKVELEQGKEIIVKLIHNPKNKENSYRIDLNEFIELKERNRIVKWIKK